MPAVEFPDPEEMVVEFAQACTAAPVGTKVPNPRPPLYVRIAVTGGSAVNRVIELVQVTVTVGAAGTSDEGGDVIASREARRLRTAFLNDYTAMPLVRGVAESVRPYYDPDPATGEDRYSFTLQMSVRGAR